MKREDYLFKAIEYESYEFVHLLVVHCHADVNAVRDDKTVLFTNCAYSTLLRKEVSEFGLTHSVYYPGYAHYVGPIGRLLMKYGAYDPLVCEAAPEMSVYYLWRVSHPVAHVVYDEIIASP